MTATVDTHPCNPDTLAEPCVTCGRHMHRGSGGRTCVSGHPRHDGAGRCHGCRTKADRRATRSSWSRDALLDTWVDARTTCSFDDFPARVGLSRDAWQQAFRRAQRDGDDRATLSEPRRPAMPDDIGWRDHAACRDADPSEFFPDVDGRGHIEKLVAPVARSYCAPCPVRTQCLAYAHAQEPMSYGLWGGTWFRQRAAVDVLGRAAS